MEQTDLFNFRIPSKLKQQFQETCQKRNTAMTSVLNEFVHDYVYNHEKYTEEDWEPIMLSCHDMDDCG